MAQHTDLLTYFDKAYGLSRQFSDKSVLSYAIARLRSLQVRDENWPLLQSLLCQCLLSESGTFTPALMLFAHHARNGGTIDTDMLAKVMNMQIAYHGPLGHGSEVAWALWAALSFQLQLVPSVARVLSTMNDSVVVLLALHAREEGLFQVSLRTENWRTYLTADDLYGPQWLLCYEASVKGWLTPPNGRDHIAGDGNFAWLRHIGVEFYDRTRFLGAAGSPEVIDPDFALMTSMRASISSFLGEYQEDGDENEADSVATVQPSESADLRTAFEALLQGASKEADLPS